MLEDCDRARGCTIQEVRQRPQFFIRAACNRPVQLGDPAGWPKIRLLNRDFGSILSVFPRKNSKTQSSLNFLQSGPRKFTKSDFSGLAPIRRVLISSCIREIPAPSLCPDLRPHRGVLASCAAIASATTE